MPKFPILRKEFRRWLLEKRDTKTPISKSLVKGACAICPLALAIFEIKKRKVSVGCVWWHTKEGGAYDYPLWAKSFIRKLDETRNLRNEEWSDIPPLLALQILDSTSKGPAI